MKKRIVIIAVVWLVVGTLILLSISAYMHYRILGEITPAFSEYVKFVDGIYHVDELKVQEREHKKIGDEEVLSLQAILSMRSVLENYAIREKGAVTQQAVVYTSKNGDCAYSRGVWAKVHEAKSYDSLDNMYDVRYLFSVTDAMEIGYGLALYESIKGNEESIISVDEYTMEHGICKPIKLTVYDEKHQVVCCLDDLQEDISLPVLKSDQLWIEARDVKKDIESIYLGSDRAQKLANQYVKNVEYGDKEQSVLKKIIRPFSATAITIDSQGEYALVTATYVSLGLIGLALPGVAFGVWTIIMGIVLLVSVLLFGSKQKKRNESEIE